MQPESHPFEKENYLPIITNQKKTQGMVDSKRTSCPGCMRFHMVSKPSGASQKRKKKGKRQKDPMTPPICVVRKITKPRLSCWNPKTSWVFWHCICYSSPKSSQEFSHTHMLRKRGTISRTIRTWQSGPRCFHSHSFTAIALIHSVHKQRPSGCSQSGSFKGHEMR